MRSARGKRDAGGDPRLYSIQSNSGPDAREDSMQSSRMGSYMDEDPTFESQNSDSDTETQTVEKKREIVSVVWQNLTLEASDGWFRRKKRQVLKNLSGFAEPRAFLAVAGPQNSGKTALLKLIGNQFSSSATATGTLLVNGKPLQQTWVRPTFFDTTDEPLSGVTVEQALVYTALLQMADHGENLESEVREVCQRLGLLKSLQRDTDTLDAGLRRRLTIACQMICCTSLLVMHDVLEGIQEGDALAIVRAVSDLTKNGCTAIMSCGHATTDICTFFTRAYILVDGDLLYFGDSGAQALELLSSSGMPCPPIYSPVEQYMRLIDPSFEVYLQVAGEGGKDDWNTQFSGLMCKVLQGAYRGSSAQLEADQKLDLLATSPYEPFKSHQGMSGPWQCFILCRRLVTQGLQGLPLYLGRIIFSVLIAVIMGGSYFKLNTSNRGASERTTILFLASVILPSLAFGTLPLYRNSVLVFQREARRCNVGVLTHYFALFILTLPHLAVAAIFAAVILIPMVDLNQTNGAAWGYFFVNTTLCHMCADALILAFSTLRYKRAYQGAVSLLVIQAFACGFFPGANRGLNLPVHIVSFFAWSYKGLLQNEYLYRSQARWSCPEIINQENGPCSLSNLSIYKTLSEGQIVLTDSRWNAVYILVGIYAAWALLYILLLWLTLRVNRKYPNQPFKSLNTNGTVITGENPLHTGNKDGVGNGNASGLNSIEAPADRQIGTAL